MEHKHAQKQGYVQVYAGNGKGKSTAAAGLTFRASGRNWQILFIQFLKSGNSAELRIMEKLDNIKLVTGQKVNKFTFHMTEEELATAKAENQERLEMARSEAANYDMVVLDEALGAIAAGVIEEESLIDFMKHKPKHTELVITGRGPSDAVIEATDYYTECCERKHPYQSFGLNARPGIEF
ncbi:MAG: cob(I)yrinic acid a,c-diamide adenosyltransferase [Eubacteriales bacterium]|nr:cob(I)yrinic acid a,c-diamide adenosyltransferase [Eubacteriales bacterium]